MAGPAARSRCIRNRSIRHQAEPNLADVTRGPLLTSRFSYNCACLRGTPTGMPPESADRVAGTCAQLGLDFWDGSYKC
jgi:hypothetical protein